MLQGGLGFLQCVFSAPGATRCLGSAEGVLGVFAGVSETALPSTVQPALRVTPFAGRGHLRAERREPLARGACAEPDLRLAGEPHGGHLRPRGLPQDGAVARLAYRKSYLLDVSLKDVSACRGVRNIFGRFGESTGHVGSL